MFKNYFKIAMRNLSRNKIYSFINIAGLSIGLACAMLILLYVKDEVSYDRFHKNANNIYRITTQGIDKNGVKGRKDPNTGYLQGPRFAQNIPDIKYFVRVQSGTENIKTGTEVKDQDLLYVDSNFFSVFVKILFGPLQYIIVPISPVDGPIFPGKSFLFSKFTFMGVRNS